MRAPPKYLLKARRHVRKLSNEALLEQAIDSAGESHVSLKNQDAVIAFVAEKELRKRLRKIGFLDRKVVASD